MMYGFTIGDWFASFGLVACLVLLVILSAGAVQRRKDATFLRGVQEAIAKRDQQQMEQRIARFKDAKNRPIPWEPPQDNGLDLTMLEVYHEPTIDQPGTDPLK